MATLQDRINKALTYTFYALFFVTPFAMTNVNHELFEFNKMLLVYFFTAVVFFLWGFKMVAEKRFFVRRTLLDIPILLFFASQLISTIISLEPHTSFWGYYTRFNGGLLSTISYIFLYYALVTNFFATKDDAKKFVKKILGVSILSGLIVTLWGLPGHFGYDPTCFVFRFDKDASLVQNFRNFNTSCWTDAFDPKVRIFSTLGQPNWLAAYLAILIPFSLAFFVGFTARLKSLSGLKTPKLLIAIISSILFYIALVWTNSQSGFIGLWAGIIVFIGILKFISIKKNGFSPIKLLKLKSLRLVSLFLIIFFLLTLVFGNPFPRFEKFSLVGIMASQKVNTNIKSVENETAAGPSLENNITGSGKIRLIVWKGALEIFKANPLIGSGVETFAYAYYKHRPIEHNLTSEWDFLYNKAHNEYLNYLATTGLLGLGSYLFFIGLFLYKAARYFMEEKSISSALLPASLVGAFISILVSNFFGFSVVLINLYLFLIPAFFFMLTGNKLVMFSSNKNNNASYKISSFSSVQFVILSIIVIVTVYWIWFLLNYWNADKAYALGYNFNKIDESVKANQYLEKAVSLRPGEDLYKNELSTNLASIALIFAQDNQTQNASTYGQRAKELSDEVVSHNPNNLVYYKTRTRTLFTLAQIQPQLLNDAYQTILKAHQLAPTDAKIMYNKALIEEVIEKRQEALKTLDQTLALKPNYVDARYRKAIVLSNLAKDEKDPKKAKEYNDSAKKELEYIINNLAPDFAEAKELLKTLE